MFTWINNYRNWWSSLTSTFVGSLLGIGITFGISDYIQDKQQKEMSRKLLITTMCDIQDQCHLIGHKCQIITEVDSIFSMMVYCYYHGEKFPEDRIAEYYDINEDKFEALQSLSRRISERKPFTSNAEIIDIFSELSIVNDIKKIYLLIQEFEESVEDVYKLKDQILSYDKKYKIRERENLNQNFIQYQFEHDVDKRYEQILHFSASVIVLQNFYKKLNNEFLPYMKEKLHITEKDMTSAKSTIEYDFSTNGMELAGKFFDHLNYEKLFDHSSDTLTDEAFDALFDDDE